MTKYNQLFKQQVVDFYFQHDENLPATLRHFNLPETTVSRWIAQFKHSGSAALAVRHTKRSYTTEFKMNVVQSITTGTFCLEEATLYFGLPSSGMISQ